jgi:RHS repeat-associated protein
VLAKTYPDGGTERYEHDAAGQFIRRIRPRSVTRSVTRHNIIFLLTATVLAKTYPDGGTERYEHDAAGQLTRRIRPDGSAATHNYDSRGRLLSVKWDADRSEPITYTYDAAGRMTSASNTSATVARSYTATGRLATETQTIRLPDLTQPVENRLTYEYSPDGRLAAITYPDASKVQHYHNARGELIEIIDTQPMAGLDANNSRYTYTRRPDGKITALTHPNGVTTTRDYDEVGRLAKITHLDPTGKVLESEASTYDQRDRRLTRTRADGSTDLFRYDPAGQVTAAAYAQASDPQNPNPVNPSENPVNPVEKSDEAEQKDFTPNQTFVYDEAGNRLEVTENGMTTKYQPNDANQYAKIAHGTEVVEPEYDPQGNLLHDATRQYTWDADIHLTAVSTQTGQPGTKNPEQRTEFKYDPLHRRIARVKDSGEVTLYVYEGWNVVQETTRTSAVAGGVDPGAKESAKEPQLSKAPTAPQLDTENFKLETRYTWGEDLSGTLQGAGGIGGLLRSTIVEAKPNGPRQTEHEHTFSYDSNGNIILLTDAQANESARYSYDAFGQTLTATGPAAQMNRYRFSTKPVEEESGLVYYGYRWYDPVTGRWPSRDPIEERGGVNLYGMVGNGALTVVDKLGLTSTLHGPQGVAALAELAAARALLRGASNCTCEQVASALSQVAITAVTLETVADAEWEAWERLFFSADVTCDTDVLLPSRPCRLVGSVLQGFSTGCDYSCGGVIYRLLIAFGERCPDTVDSSNPDLEIMPWL